MAILDDVPGIRITLVSTGQNLVEHEVTDEEEPQPNTTSTFVQAESGRTFGFAITFDAALFPYKNDNIALALLKDGEMVRYWHFAPFFIASGFRKVINRFSVKEGGGNLAVELSFAELHISTYCLSYPARCSVDHANMLVAEENADMELWGKLGALGTVAFELCRIRYEYTPIRTPRQDNQFHMRGTARGRKGKALKNHSQRHGRYPVQLKRALLADDTVSEKNLKGRAISHQAKSGNPSLDWLVYLLIHSRLNVHHWQSTESANANPSPTIRRTIQIDRTPFARFVFKYRSYGE